MTAVSYVLVHGICHGAWCWDTTVDALRRAGHRAVAVDLPLTSLEVDAQCVRDVLDGLERPVVLVGHSYGGLVISRAAGGRTDVDALVYVAAVMLAADDILRERAAETPAVPLSSMATFTDDGHIVVAPPAAAHCFYNACDPEVAEAAARRLRPTASECLDRGPGAEPWRTIPSTYLVCTQDRAIHPQLQARMATRAGTVVTYDTDHSPFLSIPERFVADLLDVGDRTG
ncbi:MAG: alpha/beta fold hydrolase [Ilumatobacteraceae bacterium]